VFLTLKIENGIPMPIQKAKCNFAIYFLQNKLLNVHFGEVFADSKPFLGRVPAKMIKNGMHFFSFFLFKRK